LTNTTLHVDQDSEATLRVHGEETTPLQSQLFIYTAGAGIRDLFKSQFAMHLPVRFWKSHLLITSRLTGPGVFYLDPKEAAIMHHDQCSIVGLNEDAVECPEPNSDVHPASIAALLAAVHRAIKVKAFHYLPVACIKVDVAPTLQQARSLNVNVFEPLPQHICALPGKMSEAPYVTDMLVKLTYQRLASDRIAQRPCDIWMQQELTKDTRLRSSMACPESLAS
jgi:hypothetical protein